ncbi:MAG: hypothetical protein ABI693_28335, partial [Bryobacteraceae bacterium]
MPAPFFEPDHLRHELRDFSLKLVGEQAEHAVPDVVDVHRHRLGRFIGAASFEGASGLVGSGRIHLFANLPRILACEPRAEALGLPRVSHASIHH